GSVYGFELVGWLEPAVFGDRGCPGDVLRTRNVAGPLRALLREILRRQELTGVLLRRADIDDLRAVPRHDFVEDVIAQRADRCVGRTRSVLALRVARRVAREWPLLRDPFRSSPVRELHVFMAVVLQEPEEPRGEPVVVVAIGNDGRPRRDPVFREKRLKLFLVEQVAHRMLL